jgi:hypothetical protein
VSGPTDARAAAAAFTVVACAAVPCHGQQADELRAALQECVAGSPLGVLVVAGCTMGATGCRLRPAGPVLVVQPCDAERRPVGPAIRVGPVRTAQDVEAVRNWLGAARFDPAALPARLTVLHRATRTAARN